MKFTAKDESPKDYTIPDKLTPINKIDPDQVGRTRDFVFEDMGTTVNINGKQFDMDRIDKKLKVNDTEIWEISNESGMVGQFKVDK